MRKQNEMWDLSTFGYREIDLAQEILKAVADNGYPDDFEEEGVRIEFNPNTGDVFLTNDENQVCMVAEGKLESWYWLSNSGREDFLENLIQDFDSGYLDSEDYEELANICESRGFEDKANEIRVKIKEEEL